MTDILGGRPDGFAMLPSDWQAYTDRIGEPRYRADQIFRHAILGRGPTEMSNIKKELRERLSFDFAFPSVTVKEKLISSHDGTVKYLFELSDGALVEGVLMRYRHGNSLCVSSQVGCRMGCRFCASTIGGKERDLLASEILGQVNAAAKDSGERVSNIVMMGIGEPLDNYDNVLRFLRLVNLPEGPNIGYRHISLSTCGLVDGIKRLAEENLPITLSVSLHATTDEARNAIMPVNKTWHIDALLSECYDYFKKTGRRISFEYALLSGKNDSDADALSLARLLRSTVGRDGGPVHVNLIRVNPVKERDFEDGGAARANRFCRLLGEHGLTATVRRRLGEDVNAACGQLRRSREPQKDAPLSAPAKESTLRFHAASDTGLRRKSNQDRALALPLEGGLLAAVFDGMGGAAAGGVAASLALDTFRSEFSSPRSVADPEELLSSLMEKADARIKSESRADPKKLGMGTTAVSLLLLGGCAYFTHAGDSRLYLLRGGKLYRLTEDHTYVARLLERGMITEEAAETHPRRHVLLRALGGQTATAECGEPGKVTLLPEDVLLLSSDGLHGFVKETKIKSILMQKMPPELTAGYLIAAANEAGGEDNISAVVIAL